MKKQNFLLIVPRVVSKIGEGYVFPIGLAYISAAMKDANFNVINLNLNHIEGDIEKIISSAITKNMIDVVMTGGFSVQYSCLKNVVDCVHNSFPQVKIVVGGQIISGDPKVAMSALEYADIGVIGEGEITVVELCNALQKYEDSKQLSEIAGIIYKDNGDWVQTKAREQIKDLAALPLPDYDGLELDKYLELPSASIDDIEKKRSFFVSGCRSCPHKCTFCTNTIIGKSYRSRPVDSLAKEIKILVEKYGVTHIRISDELFAKDKKKIQIVDGLSKQLNITWSTNFRADYINDELIEILKNSNCLSICLGLESADNRILKSMRKEITVEQIDNALQLLRRTNIMIRGNFIFGDIEETRETAENTLRYWENHKDSNINLAFINVYPGTYLYRYALQKGIIKDPVQFLKNGCPNVNVSKLSNKELSYITKRIILLSANQAEAPNDCEMLSIKDKKGVISFKGKCVKCEKENTWENIKIFIGNAMIYCYDCEQKHKTPFLDMLQGTLLNNISLIYGNVNKIGLWGVNKSSLTLFEKNNIFKGENIVFMDNSVQKQMLKIHEKKVYSPDEALDGKIDTVIFFYPRFYADIAEKIKRKHQNVKRFINVYDLLTERNQP